MPPNVNICDGASVKVNMRAETVDMKQKPAGLNRDEWRFPPALIDLFYQQICSFGSSNIRDL